jgi:hypothetical protein
MTAVSTVAGHCCLAAVEGKAGIRNVQAVDNLLPADKFWVTLDNAWARRATLRNTTADRHLRVTDEMPDGAPWKLLVRDCDVDKAHKRLSDAGGAAAGDMESIAAVHALCEDNWQVLPAADDVPDGWRLASCWEGECYGMCMLVDSLKQCAWLCCGWHV